MQQFLLCMSQYRFLNNHAFNVPPVENYFSAASVLSNSVLPICSSPVSSSLSGPFSYVHKNGVVSWP